MAPAGTDPAIIGKQGRDLGTVLGQPELQRKFLDLATYARPMSPGETNAFILSQQQMWKPVLAPIVAKLR
jgi:tripartite-type tricarboxylate transporter receptor subunit TctC